MNGASQDKPTEPRGSDGTGGPPPNGRNIEMRIEHVGQLFDPLDPSPLRERGLSEFAESYIVESVKELDGESPGSLILHVDPSARCPDKERIAAKAIGAHFERRSRILRNQLRQLMRQGIISFFIGVGFLAVFFLAGRALVHFVGENALTTFLTESLIIGGWVAMWRPLEIFLYDWWPIVGERRLLERLSRLEIRTVPTMRTPDVVPSDR